MNVLFASGRPEYTQAFRGNMQKLNYHISQLSNEAGINAGQVLNLLKKNDFTRDDAYIVTSLLDSLKNIYRKKFLYYSNKKDAITDSLVNVIGKDGLVKRREETFNESLSEQLLNQTVLEKTYETKDRIIQKSDPVYMMPGSSYGRAHFFAPFKRIGKLNIDTLWFNVFVIWLMSFLLFVTLYYNVLKKFIDQLEKVHISGFGRQRFIPLEWTR